MRDSRPMGERPSQAPRNGQHLRRSWSIAPTLPDADFRPASPTARWKTVSAHITCACASRAHALRTTLGSDRPRCTVVCRTPPPLRFNPARLETVSFRFDAGVIGSNQTERAGHAGCNLRTRLAVRSIIRRRVKPLGMHAGVVRSNAPPPPQRWMRTGKPSQSTRARRAGAQGVVSLRSRGCTIMTPELDLSVVEPTARACSTTGPRVTGP